MAMNISPPSSALGQIGPCIFDECITVSCMLPLATVSDHERLFWQDFLIGHVRQDRRRPVKLVALFLFMLFSTVGAAGPNATILFIFAHFSCDRRRRCVLSQRVCAT